MNWAEGKEFCRATYDSHLVEIYNSKQNQFIKDKVKEIDGSSPQRWYIGLTDKETTGIWKWDQSGKIANYTSWYPGQPNSESEHYVGFYDSTYDWFDRPGTDDYNVICQKMSSKQNIKPF